MGKRSRLLSLMAFVLVCVLFSGTSVEATAQQGTVTSQTLNVRADASATSERLGFLRLGDVISIVRTTGDWHEIHYQGKKAYVHKNYVRVGSSSSSSNEIAIYVNNEKLTLPISNLPMENNQLLVPFRAIGEALGIDVRWRGQTRQVWAKDGGTEILFTLNQERTAVNDRFENVRPAPRIAGASTVIPLRFFAETFGADVSWIQAKKEVRINRGASAPAPVTPQPDSDAKGAYLGQVNRAETLNVRTGPSTDHSSLGRLAKGERVQVLGFSDRWAKIEYSGRDAYVHSYYLDLYSDNKQLKMLGQPAIANAGNTTSVTWPKLGGTVSTSHTQSGNHITIQTDAKDFERLARSVTGLSNISYSKNQTGQTMTFTVATDYQVSVSHTVGELILNVSPKVKGKPLSGKKIVIDPGHGGTDPGAVGNGLNEKDIVLDVSLRAEKLLREAGAHVIMTRDNDVYPTLTDRVKVANDVSADIFISVHANAAQSTSANGTETFWNATYSSKESERLANAIHKQMIAKLGTRDRGVKEGNFQVIRQSKMPSVLLELAFISNPSDAELLKKDSFRKNSAQAIYDGLVDYYK